MAINLLFQTSNISSTPEYSRQDSQHCFSFCICNKIFQNTFFERNGSDADESSDESEDENDDKSDDESECGSDALNSPFPALFFVPVPHRTFSLWLPAVGTKSAVFQCYYKRSLQICNFFFDIGCP